MRFHLLLPTLACLALPATADEITDAIQSALDAYNDGDAAYALEELTYATQLLKAKKTDDLVGFLPPAPDGWTREIDTDMAAGMAVLGGGSGASAEYTDYNNSFTITFMADSPMVASMGAMFLNPAFSGGKPIRIGRTKFINNDGELLSLIDNRILVQASGGTPEQLIPLLEQIDFRGLRDFGN